MEWEIFNEENMLELQGILIAYTIFFVNLSISNLVEVGYFRKSSCILLRIFGFSLSYKFFI